MKKVALLIWSEIIASLALSNTDATASSSILDTGDKSNKIQIAIKEESKPDLFLRQAAEDYAGQMMFAGHRSHRSHSSHRSHYSSRSYSSPPTTTTTTLPRPTNVIDTTSAKMIQVALKPAWLQSRQGRRATGWSDQRSPIKIPKRGESHGNRQSRRPDLLDTGKESKSHLPGRPKCKKGSR